MDITQRKHIPVVITLYRGAMVPLDCWDALDCPWTALGLPLECPWGWVFVAYLADKGGSPRVVVAKGLARERVRGVKKHSKYEGERITSPVFLPLSGLLWLSQALSSLTSAYGGDEPRKDAGDGFVSLQSPRTGGNI